MAMEQISENDFELLEEYLDEALGDSARRAVEARLEGDAALCRALGELESGRAMRAGMFASMEPGEAEECRVIERISSAVLRDGLRHRAMGRLGWAASLAAGIAVAFIAGWMCHRLLGTPGVDISGGVAAVASPAGYQVRITDDTGNVVAVQKFASLEQAREFTDDLAKWQLRQQQLQQGQVVLVGDTF